MIWMYLLLLCFTNSFGCRSKKMKPEYFSNSEWGGWFPKDNSWKSWIEKWGKEDSSTGFDSVEVDKRPDSGWPSHWKGMGKSNPGVPAPPWAYEPENYGRSYFCYLQPDMGNGNEMTMIRWGFNPTAQMCQTFPYTGQGGNENNFWNKETCERACTGVPSADCYKKRIKFNDYIDD